MEQRAKDNFPFSFKNLPADKVWFTSDPHFLHANIIKYCNRPFISTEEMTYKLIRNWNSVIGNDDLIFCLGDFALGRETDCTEILKQLNGHKLLIKGNHEKTVMSKAYNRDLFEGGIYELLEISVDDEEVSDGFQPIVLCHYPMISWNRSHRGAWQLFGHVHGMLDGNPVLSPNQIDVGVDSHHFEPISYQKVKEIITQNNIKKIKQQ